jgi:hypothetical protein
VSAGWLIERREFLRFVAALPGAALLGWRPAPVVAASSPMVFVYEPSLPESVWRRVATRHGPLEVRPLEGDRVRFARALLARAPQAISGLTRHVDLLLLAGTAEEEGFRMREQSLMESVRGRQPALVCWSMHRRRA